jgi:heme-degrading monooxygenase HmoA
MRRSLDARGTRLVSRVRAAGSAHENRDPTTCSYLITLGQAPDSVDGPIRFAVKTVSQAAKELPGFLALFDLSDRTSGRAVIVTLWATEEARAASMGFAREATTKVADAGTEEVISMRDYEVGHYLVGDGFPTS